VPGPFLRDSLIDIGFRLQSDELAEQFVGLPIAD
jgi:hypothetical protein